VNKTGKRELTLRQTLPYILLFCSLVGLLAAFALTYDKIQVLKDPAYNPNCNINPILSCGSVMKTEQASLFGVPNTILGLMGFSGLATIAVALLAGAKFKKWFWWGIQAGAIGGLVFMLYLFFQGVFRINAICPWCFATWMVTIPIFWYTTLYNLREKNISLPTKYGNYLNNFMQKHHGNILVVFYLIIFGILLQHFWYYWQTLI
jgi:uncharacterized membrane protein